MTNEQNLRPPFTPEEAREFGKKGAAASAKARRKKKSIAETVEKVLNTKVTDKKQLATIQKAGLPVPEKPTYRDFIVASVIMQSVKRGSVGDLSKLMDIIGEAPVMGGSEEKNANNLLDAIQNTEEINTDDLPEVE